MSDLLLEVNGVSKRFCQRPELGLRYAVSDVWREVTGKQPKDELRAGEFWALKDVSFTLRKGEVLGVIGHNGAGKSTLINLVAGLMRPTMGEIRLYTHKVALMDASGGINQIQTGRENILTQLALHKCPPDEIETMCLSAIEFAELGSFIDAAVGTYSLGMRLRLAFSIYTCLKPDLFIVDEALSGGDIRFRRKFQTFIKSYIDSGGSILYCSHELFTVQTLCRETLLLDGGRERMMGQTDQVLAMYYELMDATAEAKVLSSDPFTMAAQSKSTQAESIQADSTEAESIQPAKSETTPPPPKSAPRQTYTVEGSTDPQTSVAGYIKIESVTISRPDGSELEPGCPAEIEIVCNATEVVDKVMVVVEIGQGEIFPIWMIVEGYGEHQYGIHLGKNVMTAHIDAMPLAPGLFQAKVVITSDDGSGVILAWLGWESPAYVFRISNPATKEFNMLMYRRSLVHYRADWR